MVSLPEASPSGHHIPPGLPLIYVQETPVKKIQIVVNYQKQQRKCSAFRGSSFNENEIHLDKQRRSTSSQL